MPNECNTLLRCEICSDEDMDDGNSFDLLCINRHKKNAQYQFFRTPHLNTRDLRCLISSSGDDVTGLVVLLDDFAVDLLARLGSLVVCLRGFAVEGLESLRTDISE